MCVLFFISFNNFHNPFKNYIIGSRVNIKKLYCSIVDALTCRAEQPIISMAEGEAALAASVAKGAAMARQRLPLVAVSLAVAFWAGGHAVCLVSSR